MGHIAPCAAFLLHGHISGLHAVIPPGIGGIRTPARAYYQYGESPYQSKPKALKWKVTAPPRGGVGSNWTWTVSL